MNKNEFISRLRELLSPLSEEEKENAINYYEEFIADSENEKEALSQLGSPEQVAKQILSENGINNENMSTNNISNVSENKPPKNTALIILIIILTFPLWIGIAAGAFGIVVAAFSVAFALIVSFVAVGVSCLATGIILLFSSFSVGLVLIGVGLVTLSLFVVAILPLLGLIANGVKKLLQFIGIGFNKLFKKEVA